ncbi:hypothetical protein [Scytonema sp. HK-05]|nr:hypothetical protein [Scytonema sp. HK-05]
MNNKIPDFAKVLGNLSLYGRLGKEQEQRRSRFSPAESCGHALAFAIA